MVDKGTPPELNLGLASRRLKKRISLEQISEATKIGVRSLEAIEAGDFKKLPGGIYNTNYIRQYARAIEFDESEILLAYNAVMGLNSEPKKTPEQKGPTSLNLVNWFLRHTSAVLGSSS